MTIRISGGITSWPEDKIEFLLDEARQLFSDEEPDNAILPLSFGAVGILSGGTLLIKSASD